MGCERWYVGNQGTVLATDDDRPNQIAGRILGSHNAAGLVLAECVLVKLEHLRIGVRPYVVEHAICVLQAVDEVEADTSPLDGLQQPLWDEPIAKILDYHVRQLARELCVPAAVGEPVFDGAELEVGRNAQKNSGKGMPSWTFLMPLC